MADEPKTNTDPQAKPTEPTTPPADPKPTEPTTPEPGATVNAYKYQRDIDARDAKIADLEAQLNVAKGANKGNDDAMTNMAKRIEAMEQEREAEKAAREAEKVDASLKAANCIDTKAASARLNEFDGDIEKLKEACPYLFKANGTQSTGGNPAGTPDVDGERLSRLRQIMGAPKKKD